MPRRQHKYHFIYKTTNLKNGTYYIGMHSTSDLNDEYLGSGDRLRRSIRKHGKENFLLEILEFFDSREDLAKRERDLVNEALLLDPMCMNLAFGGIGGYISDEGCRKGGSNMMKKMWKDESFKEKQFKKSSERFKTKWKTGEFKYIDFWTGRKHSSETISKMREKAIGRGIGNSNSQYGTCWITDGVRSKKIKKGDLIPNGWKLGRS